MKAVYNVELKLNIGGQLVRLLYEDVEYYGVEETGNFFVVSYIVEEKDDGDITQEIMFPVNEVRSCVALSKRVVKATGPMEW